MLKFGHINIPSKDPAFTSKFISFVFDEEPFYSEQSDIRFFLDGVEFRVLEEGRKPGQHEFTFIVENQDSLAELKSKIELFCYTNALGVSAPIIGENQLKFKDSHGGSWLFETENEKFTPIVDKNNSDVRFR